jgi:hypothetical protein
MGFVVKCSETQNFWSSPAALVWTRYCLSCSKIVCQTQYDGTCSGEKAVQRIVCQVPIHYNYSAQFSADMEKRTSMSQIVYSI